MRQRQNEHLQNNSDMEIDRMRRRANNDRRPEDNDDFQRPMELMNEVAELQNRIRELELQNERLRNQ